MYRKCGIVLKYRLLEYFYGVGRSSIGRTLVDNNYNGTTKLLRLRV